MSKVTGADNRAARRAEAGRTGGVMLVGTTKPARNKQKNLRRRAYRAARAQGVRVRKPGEVSRLLGRVSK